ncbi:Prenylated Rab acceptor protein 1 [Saxophila tyrrhenica]|uniref:Prenylated Rab acceptor protein 1 n=1 Tax=Saxophila tyrrhenica TaxID=1690608 RepID=A0AAV9P8R7_9PEZI|nr:Prenylated Rab acceptor protein 1 [Saxophila tyrrhenica]
MWFLRSTLVAASLASLAFTAPMIDPEDLPRQPSTVSARAWDAGGTMEYDIQFCNNSETALLGEALDDMSILATHAKDHILRFGHSSDFYIKYFGNASTGEPAGWFDKIVNGDKTGVLFRCDDPDNNCRLEGWGGHWRGENGSDETVICEYSFTNRWPLAGLCGYGYTVAGSENTAYFASDLIHRVYHTDKLGEGVVGHYADTYDECLELAMDSPEEAVRNSATLRYFALDVYAYDIAAPGQGCTGEAAAAEAEDHGHDHDSHDMSSSSSVPASSSSTAMSSSTALAVSTTESTGMSMTASAASECHTHSDGEVHCA